MNIKHLSIIENWHSPMNISSDLSSNVLGFSCLNVSLGFYQVAWRDIWSGWPQIFRSDCGTLWLRGLFVWLAFKVDGKFAPEAVHFLQLQVRARWPSNSFIHPGVIQGRTRGQRCHTVNWLAIACGFEPLSFVIPVWWMDRDAKFNWLISACGLCKINYHKYHDGSKECQTKSQCP